MEIPKLKGVIRLDGTDVYATHFTEEGYLMDKPVLTRTGIFKYANGDGTERSELRLPEEVFNKESLKSYKGKPIIITHSAGLIDKDNVGSEYIGTILTDGEKFEDDKVTAEIVIHEADAMKDCGLRELSIGYSLDLEETPGTWNGMHYDAIQRNIRVNHLALVQEARAGDDARLNIDSKNDLTIRTGGRNTTMAKKTKTVNHDGVVSEQELARLLKEYLEKHKSTENDADDVDVAKPVDAVTTPDDAGKKEVVKKQPKKVAPKEVEDVEETPAPTPKKKTVVAEEVTEDAAPAVPVQQPPAKPVAPQPKVPAQPKAQAPAQTPAQPKAQPKPQPKPQPKAEEGGEDLKAIIANYETIIDTLLAKLDYQFPDQKGDEDEETEVDVTEDVEEDEDEEFLEEDIEEDEDEDEDELAEDEDDTEDSDEYEEDEDDEDLDDEENEDEDDDELTEDDFEDEDFEEDEDDDLDDEDLNDDEDDELKDLEEDEDDEDLEDDLTEDEDDEEFEEDEDDEEFEEDEDDTDDGQVTIESFKKDEGACCGNKKYQEDHRHDGKKSKRMDSAISRKDIQKEIDKAAIERAKLGVVGRQIHLDGLETMPIRKAKIQVIKKVRPSLRLDGKSDAYINAAYDMAVKDITATRKKGTEYQKRQMFKMDGNYDFAERDDNGSSNDARARMIRKIEAQSKTKKEDK
ncbi:MAG: DUF2213 domain-containing protein [Clostridia bacterium]|nr:DUF2213 domain-containing protein [Clostridia bacterium]